MSTPAETDKTKRRNKALTVEQIQEDNITQVYPLEIIHVSVLQFDDRKLHCSLCSP